MARSPLFIGQPNVVMIGDPVDGGGLTNPVTNAYDNSMTGLTWELWDNFGNQITSGSMSYVASSNGMYTGTIPASVTKKLNEEGVYIVWIKQTSDDVLRRIEYEAQFAGATTTTVAA